MENSLESVLHRFENLTKRPVDYLSVQSSLATKVTLLLKNLYDLTKKSEKEAPSGVTLPELIIEGFDEEQIWQELELQNEAWKDRFIADVAGLVARKDRLKQQVLQNVGEGDEGQQHSEEEEESMGELSDSERDEKKKKMLPKKTKRQKVPSRPSAVDDNFFKLSEMEHFLEQEEQRDAGQHDSSDEYVDLFQASDGDTDDDDDKNPCYADFFDQPNDAQTDEDETGSMDVDDQEEGTTEQKQVRFEVDDFSGSEEDEVPDSKSTLEMREERLRSKIDQLEEQALAEKPWQLKGEVSASARPQNSLLEEVVEFDLTTRPAPVITEKTTQQLEDVILQRIKDQAWDDVEKKVKPVETPNEYKKKLVLDHEKSKLSLAQVYEQEYIKQREALEADGEERPQEEPPEHQAIRTMMSSLFSMLDALSNFHYTPKPPAPEVKIVSNLPAISMEEVAPVATTDAALLAPEEIRERPKGNVMDKAERTATDRKRERRKKKMRQRERRREKEKRERTVEKLRPGLGNKYSREHAIRDLEQVSKSKNVSLQGMDSNKTKAVRSSSAFFNQLQQEVKSQIKTKTAGGSTAKKQDVRSAKKFKL